MIRNPLIYFTSLKIGSELSKSQILGEIYGLEVRVLNTGIQDNGHCKNTHSIGIALMSVFSCNAVTIYLSKHL